ncbi:MAG: helix-turn-helix domain-containing protein, partial [candidate division WOR-3 bacterium]
MKKKKSVKNNDREEKLREIALKRLEIIKFFEKYGVEATKDAFGVARATVYLWKKKFRESGGKIESLIPKSRAPIRR